MYKTMYKTKVVDFDSLKAAIKILLEVFSRHKFKGRHYSDLLCIKNSLKINGCLFNEDGYGIEADDEDITDACLDLVNAGILEKRISVNRKDSSVFAEYRAKKI